MNQEKIKNKINNLSELPHSILLLGPKGAGHLDICDYIANRFGLQSLNISELISNEFIESIYGNPNKTLYMIDISFLDERKQNSILKLYEQPNSLTYIILYGENDSTLLNTIMNRSYSLKMDDYSRDELEPLITANDKELVLSLCNTPGQIEIANHTDLNSLVKLCYNIINNMDHASFPNTLSISNKINFKDNYDKFDLFLFIKVLGYCIINLDSNKETHKKFFDILYNETILMNKNIWLMNDKKRYFEHFLTCIWEESRNEY